jgi:hypothetical protein
MLKDVLLQDFSIPAKDMDAYFVTIYRNPFPKPWENAKVALLLLLEKRYCYQCRLINLRLLVADLNTIWLLGSQSRTIVRN